MTTLGEKLREAIEKKQVQATLNAWDKHEDQIRKPQPQEKQMANPNPVIHHDQGKPHFGVSNNVVRETFDVIKNAPKMKPREYIDMLVCRGFKESSVTSLVYQLIKAGQVARDEHGQLSVTQDEYTPIKIAQRSDKKAKKETVPERKKIVLIKRTKREDPAHGIAALKADTGAEPVKVQALLALQKTFIPSAIVDQLPVLHARELYDYLKKIFGGN